MALLSFPAGVFNVVTGNGAFGQSLATYPDVNKVGFTGSTPVIILSLVVYVLYIDGGGVPLSSFLVFSV